HEQAADQERTDDTDGCGAGHPLGSAPVDRGETRSAGHAKLRRDGAGPAQLGRMSPQSVFGRHPTPNPVELRISVIRVVGMWVFGLREPSVHRLQTTDVDLCADVAPGYGGHGVTISTGPAGCRGPPHPGE